MSEPPVGKAVCVLVAWAIAAFPAVSASARTERIVVHGASLEGNLIGNSADREALVILPTDYDDHSDRSYRVVYLLHGFYMTAEQFAGLADVERASADMAARGEAMILVLPDSFTKFGGSMYSSSITTGDFERFVASDLVAYVDAHYRTTRDRNARGLAGHSMGGYGVLRIAMHHPGVFSAVYSMSACCLVPRRVTAEEGREMEAMTVEGLMSARLPLALLFASAAAWSPAPDKPPLFLDLPTHDGIELGPVAASWAANAITSQVPQYVAALKSLRGIGLDVGDRDGLRVENEAMHRLLERFGIDHDWSVYPGDHEDRLASRLTATVLPFLAGHLERAAAPE